MAFLMMLSVILLNITDNIRERVGRKREPGKTSELIARFCENAPATTT